VKKNFDHIIAVLVKFDVVNKQLPELGMLGCQLYRTSQPDLCQTALGAAIRLDYTYLVKKLLEKHNNTDLDQIVSNDGRNMKPVDLLIEQIRFGREHASEIREMCKYFKQVGRPIECTDRLLDVDKELALSRMTYTYVNEHFRKLAPFLLAQQSRKVKEYCSLYTVRLAHLPEAIRIKNTFHIKCVLISTKSINKPLVELGNVGITLPHKTVARTDDKSVYAVDDANIQKIFDVYDTSKEKTALAVAIRTKYFKMIHMIFAKKMNIDVNKSLFGGIHVHPLSLLFAELSKAQTKKERDAIEDIICDKVIHCRTIHHRMLFVEALRQDSHRTIAIMGGNHILPQDTPEALDGAADLVDFYITKCNGIHLGIIKNLILLYERRIKVQNTAAVAKVCLKFNPDVPLMKRLHEVDAKKKPQYIPRTSLPGQSLYSFYTRSLRKNRDKHIEGLELKGGYPFWISPSTLLMQWRAEAADVLQKLPIRLAVAMAVLPRQPEGCLLAKLSEEMIVYVLSFVKF
jgi:hypothetical protein